jgi:hypothetical protein
LCFRIIRNDRVLRNAAIPEGILNCPEHGSCVITGC